MESKAYAELFAALIAAQAEMRPVPRTQTNTFHRTTYADLAAVKSACDPILTRHGLAVTQVLEATDGAPVLVTYLIHTSGQFLTSRVKVTVAKTSAQELGSWLTYARRYAYCAIVGATAEGEDDDAERAEGRTSSPAERRCNQQRLRSADPPPAEQKHAPPPRPAATEQPPTETPEQRAKRLLDIAPTASADVLDKAAVWLERVYDRLPADLVRQCNDALSFRRGQLAATVE